MSKENKKLVPELRFAEFEGEWKNESFSEVYSFKITNSLSRNKLNYKEGQVKNIHYGDIHTKFPTLFDITKEDVPYINQDVPLERIDDENYCLEGDIVIADASEDLDDIGKSIEIINLNNERLLSGLHTFLARQIEPKLIIGFSGYLFKSIGIRKQIKREAQGAKVLGISKGRISDIKIYYPKEKTEQQKIAATLTTLDDLIAAEKERLAALQAHKKGLLQQLFPAKGERVPKLRFGEFEGDWEEKALGEVGKPLMCKRIFKEQTTSDSKNAIPFYKIGTFGKEADAYIPIELYKEYKRKFSYPEIGDILISASGTIGRLVIYDGSDAYYQDSNIVWLGHDESNVINSFLYYCYSTLNWQTSDGGVIKRLYNSNLKEMVIFYPKDKEEQQKIANCLSSLDDLIAAQAEKIEVLKVHKKGLMQGLFPAV